MQALRKSILRSHKRDITEQEAAASLISSLRYFGRNAAANINSLLDGRAAAAVFTWMIHPSPSDRLIVSVLLTGFLSIFLNVARELNNHVLHLYSNFSSAFTGFS